ncbi:MAG: hypothetical protein FWC68_02065 [Oscillospiraceae bacterium]|nr:hypothetical protein [Oscillospiraceae bacterium]
MIAPGAEEGRKHTSLQREKVKDLFSVQQIILYSIACMASMVSFNGNIAPFGLAIFAAVCGSKMAAGVVYVACLVGTLIGFGNTEFLNYLLTTLIFIVAILTIRPRYQNENRNEKQKVGVYIFVSTFVVQMIRILFGTFLLYDLLSAIALSCMVYIFYKIFVNSLPVIKEYGDKKAFSVEEVIGASLLLSIAFAALAGLTVYNFSITNILSIMIVLFLGWKNGMLAGATAGITIGMVLGLITESSPVLISSVAISRNVSSE